MTSFSMSLSSLPVRPAPAYSRLIFLVSARLFSMPAAL